MNYQFTKLIKPIITPKGVIYQPILEVINGSERSYLCLCKKEDDEGYYWYSFSIEEICNPDELAYYEFLCFPLDIAKTLIDKAVKEYEQECFIGDEPSASTY